MRFGNIMLASTALSLFLSASTQVRADQIGFAVDISNLYSVDLTTATATLIGHTGDLVEGLVERF
ncbi:MAG: hypothetical protein NVSMB18_29780 [Acetobacteraceae bacterium]